MPIAHRLELSLKDALSKTFFSNIDSMLMRLYYFYEKSPIVRDNAAKLDWLRLLWFMFALCQAVVIARTKILNTLIIVYH